MVPVEPTSDTDLFPVLVRHIHGVLAASECAVIVARLDRRELGPHDVLSGAAASTFHSGLRKTRFALDEVEAVVPIKDTILRQVNVYARDFGMQPVRLDNSWINVQGVGSELGFHTHPTSIISGALYLKADEQSSALCFRNPNPFVDVTEIREWTKYTSKGTAFQPVAGDLLLFPSWLKHGSLAQNLSAERIVLSFNTALYVKMQ